MILRCRFCLALFCSGLGRVYVRFVEYPHFFSASSYSSLMLFNISALGEFCDNPSLIVFASCFLIRGGWFDATSIYIYNIYIYIYIIYTYIYIYVYINLSFGFLHGRYALFSKLNVTCRKSTSVRLATISILKSIFLKIMIIFVRVSPVCCK